MCVSKNFQTALDIYTAILSVCLSVCSSIRHLPAHVVKRLNISISSAYGSAVIQLFPVLNNFAKVKQVRPTGVLNTGEVP